MSFYKREGFEIQHSGLDEATGEKDYVMTWQHKQKFQFINALNKAKFTVVYYRRRQILRKGGANYVSSNGF